MSITWNCLYLTLKFLIYYFLIHYSDSIQFSSNSWFNVSRYPVVVLIVWTSFLPLSLAWSAPYLWTVPGLRCLHCGVYSTLLSAVCAQQFVRNLHMDSPLNATASHSLSNSHAAKQPRPVCLPSQNQILFSFTVISRAQF